MKYNCKRPEYERDIQVESKMQVGGAIEASRTFTERALRMRSLSYYAGVKAQLLLGTIFEINERKKEMKEFSSILKEKNENLQEQNSIIQKQKEELEAVNKELKQTLANLKKAEIALIENSRISATAQVIQSIAHQWRQPLTIIANSLQAIQMELNENHLEIEYIKKNIGSGLEAVFNLSSIIDNFRTFYKPAKKIEVFSINDEIIKVVEMIKNRANDLKISLELECDENFEIDTYKNELNQIIFLLISNAIEAHEKNSKQDKNIRVKLQRKETELNIVIADNAGGIDEAIITKVCEPYISTKFSAQGVGLSLFMSRMIIKTHMRGNFKIENKNNGVEINIFLPLSI